MAEAGQEAHKPDKKKVIKVITVVLVNVAALLFSVFFFVSFLPRSPSLHISDPLVQTLATGTPASPSFNVTFGVTVKIKNSNFGRYRFERTPVSFLYQGIVVGQVIIPAGRVGYRSMEEIPVFVAASSRNLAGPAVATELSTGTLSLYGKVVMRGRVECWWIVERKKKAKMDCFIVFSLATKTVQRLDCNHFL